MGRMATGAFGLVVASVLGLAGCTTADTTDPIVAPSPHPTAAPAGASAAPASSEASSTEPAGLRPDGSASDNLPYFDAVNRAVIASDPGSGGRAFVDALVAAGFPKSAMQVTADTTTLGDPADSIQFSVVLAGECLIGQYGPGSGGYHSAVRPVLGTGTCLVGRTRPVDW